MLDSHSYVSKVDANRRILLFEEVLTKAGINTGDLLVIKTKGNKILIDLDKAIKNL